MVPEKEPTSLTGNAISTTEAGDEDHLPAIPQRRPQVRFERVLDEFADELTGPSQVIQDRYGFIWIGSVDGLVRFDGYHYRFYKHDLDNPYSLSSNQITAVLEDQEGTLWVGTDGGGINKFNRSQDLFSRYRHHNLDSRSLSHDRVNVLYEDSSGEIWIGMSGGGLDKLDERSNSFVHYRHDPQNSDSLASDTVYAIFEDSHGNLWVGTNNGVDQLEHESGKFIHYQHNPMNLDSLSHNTVYAIQEDTRGVLWFGTYGGGLNRLIQESGKFVDYRFDPKDPYSLSSDLVTSIIVDRSGILWIGTMGGGINRLDPRTRYFTRFINDPIDPHSPNSSYINNLFEDRSAILWVSTARALDKYDPFKEKFTQQFRQDHVTAIHEDRQGNLWVGAFDGLYKYDRSIDQVTHFRHDPEDSNSLSEWRVTDIVEDRSGTMWIGTNGGGLNRFDRTLQRFTAYRYDPRAVESLPGDVITALYVDKGGSLWVGTDNGLARFDRQGGRFIKLPLSSGLDDAGGGEIIRALLQDQRGVLWIGTEGGGLKRFEPATGLLTTYRHNKENPNSLRNNVIYTIFEDSNGLLWVGTQGGLHRFNQQTEKFSRYGVEDGLPDDEIFAILEDQNANIWVSTDHGLSKLNPSTGVFRNYDIEDGLQDNQFSAAAIRRSTGEMLFGGVNGISAFSPDQISDNPYIPPVVLLEVKQEGQAMRLEESLDSLSGLTISGNARDLEFEFAALSYSQPERNQYAYMLEGYEEEWHYLGTERIGRYTDLPGGIYTLHLKGANDDGVWNEAGLSIRLTVIPPFWETRWFWGLLAFIVIGGAIAGYRIRVMSVEGRNQELEEQIVERTKESERRRKELEALYQADEMMHRHLNIDPLLQALVDVAVDILHADKSAIFVYSSNGSKTGSANRQLVMRVMRGMSLHGPEYHSLLADRLVDMKEPIFIPDAQREVDSLSPHSSLAKIMLGEGIHSWMFLPIYIQREYFGVFNLCFTHANAFGEREQRLFQALVQRASLAIENAWLYENAQELAVIKERNRLARDLHDSVKQKTFAALAQIGASRQLITNQPERARVYMDEAENLVHDVLQELATLIQEMYPLPFQEYGLVDALHAYANEWSRLNGIQVQLNTRGNEKLPSGAEQAIYRLLQEALSNISRHSQAKCVRIDLIFNGDVNQSDNYRVDEYGGRNAVYIKIVDDGCGFEIDCVKAGVGLRSMRERVENLGGRLDITSFPSRGTIIEVVIPGLSGILH